MENIRKNKEQIQLQNKQLKKNVNLQISKGMKIRKKLLNKDKEYRRKLMQDVKQLEDRLKKRNKGSKLQHNVDKKIQFLSKLNQLQDDIQHKEEEIEELEKQEKQMIDDLRLTIRQYANTKNRVKRLQRKNPTRRPSAVPSVLATY